MIHLNKWPMHDIGVHTFIDGFAIELHNVSNLLNDDHLGGYRRLLKVCVGRYGQVAPLGRYRVRSRPVGCGRSPDGAGFDGLPPIVRPGADWQFTTVPRRARLRPAH